MSSGAGAALSHAVKWDINSDLGEVEAWRVTQSVAARVTSINVACGGHAGTVDTMLRCIRLAVEKKLCLGAHPGPYDRAHMGRNPVTIHSKDLELLLLQQVGALEKLARSEGARLHHLKLHGGLYHAVESDAPLAREYLRIVRRHWPGVKVYAKAGGWVTRRAGGSGVEVWGEAFLDRAYERDGSLTPRSHQGALLTGVRQARIRWRELVEKGGVTCRTGEWLPLEWRTMCVHSDTPQVSQWLQRLTRISS